MDAVLLIAGGLLLGILCTWLYFRSVRLMLNDRVEALQRVEAEMKTARGATDALRTENSALKATLEAERRAGQERVTLLEEARTKLSDSFQALSAEALRTNNTAFMQLAKEILENQQLQAKGDLDSRQKAIEQMVLPLADSLGRVDQQIQQMERLREGAYSSLSDQVKRMQAEAGNLVNALRAPQGRGRWGEIQLERVVELAGMTERCDFDRQPSVTSEDRRQRPDLIVHLPLGRTIVVDAKAPLKAYLEAVECTDEAERARKLKEHASQIRAHMKSLSAKSYWEQFQPAPEFVVMFLPGESVFSAALQQDPDLLEAGPMQGVILATPTTLITLLKGVAYGWREEALAANAQRIADLGKELYDRLCTLGGHFAELGKNLERAVDAYNSAAGSLESRVLATARKFRDLEAGSSRDIEVLEPVERRPRALQAAESGPR